jgi:hypothetical protein
MNPILRSSNRHRYSSHDLAMCKIEGFAGPWLVVALVFCAIFPAWGSEPPDATLARNFELVGESIGPLHYFYERSLAGNSDKFRATFQALIGQDFEWRQVAEQWRTNAGRLLAEVDTVLSIATNSATFTNQLATFENTSSLRPAGSLSSNTVYILTVPSIKARLKSGATVPGFTYDRESGRANYQIQASFTYNADTGRVQEEGGPARSPVIVLPVYAYGTAPEEASNMARIVFLFDRRGVGLHEAIETGIEKKLRFHDPFHRWFSDGFANALAEYYLKPSAGSAAASAFAAGFNLSGLDDLTKESNLRYWISDSYSSGASADKEARLQSARYAFATGIARQLLQDAGLSGIRTVFQRLGEEQDLRSPQIERIIQTVTRQDLKAVLDGYQSFGSLPEGIRLYKDKFQQARQSGNRDSALFDGQRLLELRLARYQQYVPQLYLSMAQLFEEYGLTNSVIDLFGRQIKEAAGQRLHDRAVLEREFIKFAWRAGKLPLVFAAAEDLARSYPGDSAALSVRMFKEASEGEFPRAKEIAAVMLRDPELEDCFRKCAQAVLNDDYKQ